MQKTAPKHSKYSRNETILKIPIMQSLWKIFTWGQIFKFQKTCQNPLYKSFRVVVCKKPLEKTLNIREKRPFSKSAIMKKLYPLQNPQTGWKIKIPKNMSKSILQIIQSCCVQKPVEKTLNIWEMRSLWKSAVMQRL